MGLCLLLFFGTVVYAVSRIVEPTFDGVNFAKALFGKRLDNVFQETVVDSETSCQIKCVKDMRCLSYNFRTTNETDILCQLSDSDRFTSHENLTQDWKWLYRGMEVTNLISWNKLFFFLLPACLTTSKQLTGLFLKHWTTVLQLRRSSLCVGSPSVVLELEGR